MHKKKNRGGKIRVSSQTLLQSFRKEAREIERRLDDNLTDIFIGEYFPKFEELGVKFLNDLIALENNIYNDNLSEEEKCKYLQELLDLFDRDDKYGYVLKKTGRSKIEPEVLDAIKDTVYYDIVLLREELLGKVVSGPLDDFGKLCSRYRMPATVKLIDLERYKYVRRFTHKFVTIGNLIFKETVALARREMVEVGIRIKEYLENNFDLNEDDEPAVEKMFKNAEVIRNELDFKDLNSIALECDFIKVRQKGSHAQFKHSDGRLVTIPQGRMIGKGLSIKIQKDIAQA